MKEPIKGKEYLCIKTVVMDSKFTAYIKGKVYISEQNRCITNEKNNANHFWTKKGMNEFFTETQETFEITKETIIKYKMKDEFPEVFEKEEQNGWYKDKEYPLWLGFFENDCLIYGFNTEGDYFINKKPRLDTDKTNDLQATEQEVFEALKNEAVKRGFKEGVYITPMYSDGKDYYPDENIISRPLNFKLKGNIFEVDGGIDEYRIFVNGKWAEKIELKKLTKIEIEKQLGYKIEII